MVADYTMAVWVEVMRVSFLEELVDWLIISVTFLAIIAGSTTAAWMAWHIWFK